MPSDVEIVAKVLCWRNGIAECVDMCGSAEGCAHGMRDFGDDARAVIEALAASEPATVPEPFLPADLEEDTGPPDWHVRALRALANQLTVRNDFYYPLLGAIQKLEASEPATDGWQLVPKEPTKEMVDAAYYDALAEDAAGVWRTMLAAAPTPQA